MRCRREEGNDGEVERNMATIKANEQLYNTQIGMTNGQSVFPIADQMVPIPMQYFVCRE